MISKEKIRINVTLTRKTHAELLDICECSAMTLSELFQLLADELISNLNKDNSGGVQ